MTKPEVPDRFTVYLEGQESHRGNVLLRSFVSKVQRLELVLGKLERAFLDSNTRRTDFEIVGADKVNPTSLTLHAVPHVRNYNPGPALDWGVKQIKAVGEGVPPDPRVNLAIAMDLAELAEPDSPDGYKNFWINGYAEKVVFDADYHANALRLVADRKKIELPHLAWHEGAAMGSVVGVLKKLDDYDHDREFVIVPPIGDPVTCTFPDSMLGEMGQYWSKIVKVNGILRYRSGSPFPASVEVSAGGVELYRRSPRRTLSQMRGVFEGQDRPTLNWDSLLHG